MNLDDTALIKKIIEGDVDLFSHLIDRHKVQVAKIAQKRVPNECVEEVCQDIFIKAYQSLENYAGRSPFSHWITRISIRTCCDYWRKVYRKKEVSLSKDNKSHEDMLELITSNMSIDRFVKKEQHAELKEILDLCLGNLKDKDREVLELVYLLGWSMKEVADSQNSSLTATKVRVMRARRKLRKEVENLQELENR